MNDSNPHPIERPNNPAADNPRVPTQHGNTEQWARDLIDHCPDGIWEQNAYGEIIYINSAACQIMEMSEHELLHHNLVGLAQDPKYLHQMLITLRQQGFLNDLPLTIQTPRGTIKQLGISTRVLRDSSGEITGYQSIVRDDVERENLTEMYHHQNQALTALNDIAKVLSSPVDLNHSLNQVCEHLTHITHMDTVGIVLNDANMECAHLIAHSGMSSELVEQFQYLGFDDTVTRHVLTDGNVVTLNDLEQFVGSGFAGPRSEGYHATIMVPIMQNGKSIGGIGAGSKTTRAYEQADLDILLNVSRQVARALENSDLYAKMQTRTEALSALNGIAEILSYPVQITQSLTLVCEQLAHITQMETVGIVLNDAQSKNAHLVAHSGMSDWLVQQLQTLGLDDPITRQILAEGRAIALNDIGKFAGNSFAGPREEGYHAGIFAPIFKDGKAIGAIGAGSKKIQVYEQSDVGILVNASRQISRALENAELYTKMEERLAELDGLAKLSTVCASTLDLSQICYLTTEWAQHLLHVDLCTIRLIRDNYLVRTADYPFNQPVVFGHAMPIPPRLKHNIDQRIPHITADLNTTPELSDNERQQLLQGGWQSSIVMPLVARQQSIGVLTLLNHQPHAWSQSEIDLTQTIANQVSNMIHNAQLYNNVLTEQRKIQAIFDSGLSGLFVTDANGKLTMFNRAAERITGWTSNEVIGTQYEEILGDPTLVAGSLIHEALERKQPIFSYEGRQIQTRDGRIIPAAKAIAPLIDDKQNVIGAVGAFWDLSREKRAEQSQKQFLTQVAHQLRSPLTAVLSAVEMLEHSNLSKSKKHEMWEIINRDAERLRYFANDFLVQQAILNPDRKFNLEPLPIATIMNDLTARLQSTAQNYTFNIQCMTPAPLVLADTSAVQDVVRNLLDNAVNYSPVGTTITISIEPLDDSMIDISVQDEGIGIPISDIERVFQPFYRSEQRESQHPQYSHGLGLSIAKHAVEQMGGKIWIQPSLKPGTNIHFTLRRSA